MGIDATNWAWRVSLECSAQRLVLLSLADRADETHCCYPSMARIEKDTCLNIKTVKSTIIRLIEIGLIEDTGERKGSTNRVRVLKLIGVVGRETNPKTESFQKRNEPKNGSLNEPKNGSLNEPKNGSQNLPVNLSLKHSSSNEALPIGDERLPYEKLDAKGPHKAEDVQSKFRMFLDWQPNKQTFGAVAIRYGIPAHFSDERLAAFVLYWQAEDRTANQGQWEYTFAKQLKEYPNGLGVKAIQQNKPDSLSQPVFVSGQHDEAIKNRVSPDVFSKNAANLKSLLEN